VALKWPNDVLLGGRKLAGILAQRTPVRDAVVVGLGLNVGWAPDGAASLDGVAEPAEVLRGVLEAVDAQPAVVRPMYRAELATLGQQVRVELPADQGVVEGRAVDVDDQGRLIVETRDGQLRTFDVGDIVHLRPR
jgi:BirA family biotin operon repressor/biotin-[acetyl-CoA-carboxylase] ligase